MTQGSVRDTTGYVNYVYNISARGTTQVASQLMGLSNVTGSILGQLAFQTSSYLSSTEGALLSMGIVATAGFSKATQKASEFDQALSTIGAISGKTRSEVSGLGDQAIAMSNKFGMAVGEMTTGLEALARAGVSTGNMNAILEQAMGLSKLEGLSLETAINDLISTTNLLDTTGLDLESPEYAEAVKRQNQRITATSEAAPINAQDIIHTLEHVGGYASSTNLDQDDLFAVIAQLGSKGTKSEMAGTSLRAFLAAGQKDTAQRALKRIGLEVSDLWKNDDTIMSITDMKDVLDQAMEAKGYTRQEKLEFYSDFAGYKQANQIMKIDTQSAREFKEKIDRSWDMGKKIEQVIGTAETHLQGLVQAGTNLLIKVGEPFLPIVSTIAATLKTGIDVINMIPGSNFIIAGGLVLASVKAISTIFNKIVPQLVASKGHIGGISGLFKTIREDLHESFTLIKNINNSDFMKQRSREIEANRINEQDKYAFWESKTGKRINNMADVWRLEREHGFKNDDKYINWKKREAKKPLKREKEPRNQRKKSSNPPQGSTSSSDNRTNNKSNKKNEQLKEIKKSIDNLQEVFSNINFEFDNSIISTLADNINKLTESINNTKTDKSKETVVHVDTTIDDSILTDLKNNIFKVQVVDVLRIVPVHEVGDQKWQKQLDADKRVRDFSNRGKVEVHQNLYFDKNNKSKGNVRGRASPSKQLIQLDSEHNNTETGYHELGHTLVMPERNVSTRKSDTIKVSDISSTDRARLEGSGLRQRSYKTLGKIVSEYEADLFTMELNKLNNKDVSPKRLKRLTTAKSVLEKYDVFSDVDEDYVRTMARAAHARQNTINRKFTNPTFINDDGRKISNEETIKEKNKSTNINNSIIDNLKKHIFKVHIVSVSDKISFINTSQNIVDGTTVDTNVETDSKTKTKTKTKTDSKTKNDSKTKTSQTKLLTNGVLDQNKIDDFIDDVDIDFGFDLSTTEGRMSQEFMLNYAKDMLRENFEHNKNKLTGQTEEVLKQRIENELKGSIFKFGEEKLGSILIAQNSTRNYSSEEIANLTSLPNIDYDATLKSASPKLAAIGLDYKKVVKNDHKLLKGGGSYLKALAHLSNIDLTNVKGGKNWRSNIANKIAENFDDPKKLKEIQKNKDTLDKVFTNKIAYYYIHDLNNKQREKFMEAVGLEKTSNPYVDMVKYIEKSSEVKGAPRGSITDSDLNLIKNLGNITEFDADKLKVTEGYSTYRSDLRKGVGVKNEINSATERAIKMLGEEGYKGISSHLKKVTDAIVELAIQEDIKTIQKEIEEETGQKVSISNVIRHARSLAQPNRFKFKINDYDDVGKISPDSLSVQETIFNAAQQLHDDKIGGNEKFKNRTKGSDFGQLERTKLVHANEESTFFEEEKEELLNLPLEKLLSLTRPPDISQAYEDIGPNQVGGNNTGIKNVGVSDLEALPFIFEGQQIKNVFKRLPTHGRDMQNTAVVRDEVFGTYLGKNIVRPQLQGYLQNDKGRYHEAHSWALQQKRNREKMQNNQRKVFGNIALKYGLSRQDIMDLPLTQFQKDRIKLLYEQQDFVDIEQYTKHYQDLYDAATPEQRKNMMTGEEALRQLRGEMAAARKIELGKNGEIIDKGNMFHIQVTPEEYQRRLDKNLIYTGEGDQGILKKRKDKHGQEYYTISDFESLHYSYNDIKRRVLLEDVLRAKELESTYNDTITSEYDLGVSLGTPDLTEFFSGGITNLRPKDIVEEILRGPTENIRQIMYGLYLFDKDIYSKVITALKELYPKELKDYQKIQKNATEKINQAQSMDTALDLVHGYMPDFIDSLTSMEKDMIQSSTEPMSELLAWAQIRGVDSNIIDQITNDIELRNDFNKTLGLGTIDTDTIDTDLRNEEVSINSNSLADVIEAEKRQDINDYIVGHGVLSDPGIMSQDLNEREVQAEKIKESINTNFDEISLFNYRSVLNTVNSMQNAPLSGEILNMILNPDLILGETSSNDDFIADDFYMDDNESNIKNDPKKKISDSFFNKIAHLSYNKQQEIMLLTARKYMDDLDELVQKVQENPDISWEELGVEKGSPAYHAINQLVTLPETSYYDQVKENKGKGPKIPLQEPSTSTNEVVEGPNGSYLVKNVGSRYEFVDSGPTTEEQMNFAGDILARHIATAILHHMGISNPSIDENVIEQNNNSVTPIGYYGQQLLPTYDDIVKEQYADQYKEKVKNIKDNVFETVTSGVNKIYDTVGGHNNSKIVEPLSKTSKALGDATLKLQGFTEFLQNASDHFAPLITAVIALEGVIFSLQSVLKVTSGLEEILNLQHTINTTFKGKTFDLFGKTFEKNSNSAKILLSISSVLGTVIDTITGFVSAFLGPLLLLAGAFVTTKIALDWSYKSHQKYIKQLQDEEKANKSKSKSLQLATEQSKKAYMKNRNEQKDEVLERKYLLNKQKLDSANLRRTTGSINLTNADNDTLWGKYGIVSALDKIQGKYESTAADYDGTTGQLRRIKEHTTGGQSFMRGMPGYYSPAEERVSAYYDANKLAFGIVDEYKDELGELYDTETKAMKKNPENPRETIMFQKALDKFVEATGITKEHAQQYLDYMQTEHNVDNATQAMQAQADMISAKTEMQIQAISFGGNPADVLGLNGIEAQQNAMVQAQADMIKLELSSQLWWKAVWSTITSPVRAIISPIFAIAHTLAAIWAAVTGNWDNAGMHMQQAGASLNVLGETATYWGAWATAEGTDFSGIGQNAIDNTDRANYGNAPAMSGGGGTRVPNPESNAIFGFRQVGGGKSPHGVQEHKAQTAQNAQQSFLGALINPIFEKISFIGTLLITIVGLLTAGPLIGMGLSKLSDFPIKDLGKNLLSTFKGEGAKIFDNIFKEGTLLGKLKSKLFDPIGNSLGIRGDQIKDFFGVDTSNIDTSGIGNYYKKIQQEAQAYLKDPETADGASWKAKLLGKATVAKENFLANNAWGNYLGEKIMTDDFSKRKRKGMNAEDRDYLIKRYGLDEDEINNARTANQKNKLIRNQLDEQGKWDEAMLDLHNNKYMGDSIKRHVTGVYDNIKEKYGNPWKEYLGNQYEVRKQNLKDNINGRIGGLQEEAERYRAGDIKEEDVSDSARLFAKGLDIKEQIFGKASETNFGELLSNPKEFLSDPRNIEKMGKDIYSNYKDKYQKAKEDSGAQEEYDWYKEGGALRFADLSRENQIRAIGDKLTNIKTGTFGMDENESIQEMLQNPERTMEVLKNGYQSIQENGFLESFGLDEDFGIEDSVKDKVSGLFDKVKEGFMEGIDEDDENQSLFQKAKKKLAGLLGWTKESDDSAEYDKDILKEEMDWYKAGEIDFTDLTGLNKYKATDPHLERDVFGKQKREHYSSDYLNNDEETDEVAEIQKESRFMRAKRKMAGLLHRNKEAEEKSQEESESTPTEKSKGLLDTFKQIHNIDKDEMKEEMSQNKMAAKDVLSGRAFGNNIKYPKYYDPNLTYKEGDPGAAEENFSVLDMVGGEDLSKVGDLTKKITGGKGGKVGNLAKKITGGKGGKVGSLVKGGVSKIGKTGVGKAVSGLGRKAMTKVGSKLATKGIAQIGSKVLGGALMATGIGAPLGLLLESPIGGMLMEGVMGLGGKALGAVGGAFKGIGKAIFGRKPLGGGKGLLGGLMAMSPLGMAAGLLGGVFGGKGIGNMGKMFGGGALGLMKMVSPLGGMVGLLGSIFKTNTKNTSLQESIDKHTGETMKSVKAQNSKQPIDSSSGGNITIQNININTQDDPEAIKAMFLELIIELQEQVNPRLVSRTTGKASNSTSTNNTNDTNDTNTEQNISNVDANGNITSNRGH